MDQTEYTALLTAQSRSLQIFTPQTRFTAHLLCQMHKRWLGGIYSWAGRYRTVELEKGGFQRPPAHLVAANMSEFESRLLARHTPCSPGPVSQVAVRIAEVHADLLLIHPFRDGNGRLARWLADVMALQAGLPTPAYGFAGRGARKMQLQYLNAVVRGYRQDYELLAVFFAEAIERRLRDRPAT